MVVVHQNVDESNVIAINERIRQKAESMKKNKRTKCGGEPCAESGKGAEERAAASDIALKKGERSWPGIRIQFASFVGMKVSSFT